MSRPPLLPALALLFLLPLPATAQTEPATATSTTVNEILQKAIIGERTAQLRYATFADKAAAEGYPGAASLFRAAAEAERIHEQIFASLLAKRKGALPDATENVAAVGTTQENLSAAMETERDERDRIYHDMMEQCQALGDKEAASVLDTARTAESEHANLLTAASWSLDSMKGKKTFWVCSACGFTSDVKLPHCPSCQKSSARMKAID